MDFSQYIIAYLTTLVVFVVIDALWLGVIARDSYKMKLKKWLPKKLEWQKAAVFYVVYVLGLVLMVVIPAVESGSLGYAMRWGLMYGFFTYSTYGLTNIASIKGWPVLFTLKDIAWGAFLAWAVSTACFSLLYAFF